MSEEKANAEATQLFELDYQGFTFELLGNEQGQELVKINGRLLASERPLHAQGEYQIGHPELGEVKLQYQILPSEGLSKYRLLRQDEVLSEGEQAFPPELLQQLQQLQQAQTDGNRASHTIGLIGLFFKLFKSAKAVKVVLAGSALAAYSVIFSWQFALVLIAVIVFHEYGHLWAMKRAGLKTKGMYLIPFVGGVAVGDRASSHWQQVFIAMMGPCFGLLMSAVFFVAFIITENHFIGLVASISALVNIFNLLPVLPLDGGQVVKAMVFSGRSYLPYLGLIVMSAAMFALALQLHLGLLAFFLVLGVIDLLFSWREYKHQTVTPMDRYGVAFSLVWYLLVIAAFVFIIFNIAATGLPGSEIATTVLNS
ncbi:MAG: site-2 protease family protein [Cellvibrionaceae bacterium]|nr:site-2 protease family protein [Cellvibrionaceae bacterium]